MGGLVLIVGTLNIPTNNISQPIQLTFEYDTQMVDGTCVLWQDSGIEDGTGKQSIQEMTDSSFLFKKINSDWLILCFQVTGVLTTAIS